jgi:hypothetical protein
VGVRRPSLKGKEIAASPDLADRISPPDSEWAGGLDPWEATHDEQSMGLEDPPSIAGASLNQRLSRDPSADRTAQRSSVIASLPSSREVLDVIARHQANHSKRSVVPHGRPAFIDRQENAVRISPILEYPQAQERLSNQRKRKRVTIPETESEDDDFTWDERAIDVKRKRAEKPRPCRSQRLDAIDRASDEEPGLQLHGELVFTSTAPRRARSITPGVFNSNPPSVISEAYRPRAPAGSRSAATSTNLPSSPLPTPQVRRRWTNSENVRLIYLVGKFGPAWSKIKREDDLWPEDNGGPQLTERNQVQLKDRARNILIESYKLVTYFAFQSFVLFLSYSFAFFFYFF